MVTITRELPGVPQDHLHGTSDLRPFPGPRRIRSSRLRAHNQSQGKLQLNRQGPTTPAARVSGWRWVPSDVRGFKNGRSMK